MLAYLRVVPAAQAAIPDLVAGMQEWPDADRVAERLRKTLPPGLVEEEGNEQDPQQMQAAQMQMAAQQQAQQMQAMMAELSIRKAQAEAAEAEADAQKAAAEAQLKQLEAAQVSGGLQNLIRQQVAAQVAALTGMAQPGAI